MGIKGNFAVCFVPQFVISHVTIVYRQSMCQVQLTKLFHLTLTETHGVNN